jgi:hypothetical protein
LAAAWAGVGVLSLRGASWLDTLNAIGLLAGIVLGFVVFRGAARMASGASGRLWAVGLFLFGVLVLSPAFQHGSTSSTLKSILISTGFLAPAILVPFLLFNSRLALGPQTSASSNIDRFVLSRVVRLNLFVFGSALMVVGAQLSGQPLWSAIPQILLLALALIALGPLWYLSAAPAGVHALLWPLALVLAAAGAFGLSRYEQIAGLVRDSRAKLAENKPDEAAAIGTKIRELNTAFKAFALDRRVESDWAEYYERIGDFPMAVDRWKRVARMESSPEADFVPLQRAMWKMGNSLSAWRKLVYGGFPAVTKSEIAQGILSLADRPDADVRARLAAALVAWELKLPQDECRKRLEAVQQVAPNEPSSHELLVRLGAKLPDAPLWLPPDLIVGREPSFHTVTGTVDNGGIEEQGELSSVIVLGEGHWELLLRARGAPLHEEWPIIRLELNGHEIGRTQVTRSEDHDVPFTFDVNRGNVYQLRVVFENYMDELDNGKPARRHLGIGGMMFRRAKE